MSLAIIETNELILFILLALFCYFFVKYTRNVWFVNLHVCMAVQLKSARKR